MKICKKYLISGVYTMLPNALPIALWGTATGIAMGQSSLSLWQAISLALLAYAGSAQLVVLPLFAYHAPMIFIWLSAFLVNTRFIIFSAGLQPYFSYLSLPKRLILGYLNGDMIYLEFIKLFPKPAQDYEEKQKQYSFFLGASLINYIVWQFFNLFGIVFAQFFKTEWQIGFLGTLALVPILMSALREKSMIIITLISVFIAGFFYSLPFRLSLVIAIFTSMFITFIWQYNNKNNDKNYAG